MATTKSLKSRKAEANHLTQATVPPKKFAEEYIGRKVEGVRDFEILDYGSAHKRNILIEGPTGPGKTSMVLAYCAERGRAFYAIPSNIGIEPSQLFGKYVPDPDTGGFKWVDGPVTTLVRNGGVLLLNEVNFIPERVATILFGLLDKRRQITLLDHEAEVIDAHDDLLIVADMNPNYEGTRPLNKAFRNRFAIQLWWDYDENVESQLVRSRHLRDMAKRLRAKVADGTFQTPVSTNMLQEFEQIAIGINVDFAFQNFVTHFDSDDRASVKAVCDTFKGNIVADINELLAEDVDADEEEEVMTSQYPEDDPIWDRRANGKDGEYLDPEWGLKGRDWVYSEDENEED